MPREMCSVCHIPNSLIPLQIQFVNHGPISMILSSNHYSKKNHTTIPTKPSSDEVYCSVLTRLCAQGSVLTRRKIWSRPHGQKIHDQARTLSKSQTKHKLTQSTEVTVSTYQRAACCNDKSADENTQRRNASGVPAFLKETPLRRASNPIILTRRPRIPASNSRPLT